MINIDKVIILLHLTDFLEDPTINFVVTCVATCCQLQSWLVDGKKYYSRLQPSRNMSPQSRSMLYSLATCCFNYMYVALQKVSEDGRL